MSTRAVTDALHEKWRGIRRDVILSACFTTLSVVILLAFALNPRPAAWLTGAAEALWVIWSLAPPLHFMLEWSAYPGEADDPGFKAMRYNHELCAKFWLAGVGVMSALLVYKLPNGFHP